MDTREAAETLERAEGLRARTAVRLTPRPWGLPWVAFGMVTAASLPIALYASSLTIPYWLGIGGLALGLLAVRGARQQRTWLVAPRTDRPNLELALAFATLLAGVVAGVTFGQIGAAIAPSIAVCAGFTAFALVYREPAYAWLAAVLLVLAVVPRLLLAGPEALVLATVSWTVALTLFGVWIYER